MNSGGEGVSLWRADCRAQMQEPKMPAASWGCKGNCSPEATDLQGLLRQAQPWGLLGHRDPRDSDAHSCRSVRGGLGVVMRGNWRKPSPKSGTWGRAVREAGVSDMGTWGERSRGQRGLFRRHHGGNSLIRNTRCAKCCSENFTCIS